MLLRLSNFEADVNVDNAQLFWTGKSLENCQPLIMKLKNPEEKAEILYKAKGLKNYSDWRGVSINHDLTKQRCLAEKVKEM